VSSDEMSIFSKGIDEQTNEIAATSLAVDANASNTDEDESSASWKIAKLAL